MTRKSHFLPNFSAPFVLLFLLTGIVWIEPFCLSISHIAQAQSVSPSPSPNHSQEKPLETLLKNLSRQPELKGKKLSLKNVTPQTWPNACLGLPKPGEVCAQMLVEGWRVTVFDGSKTWTYRSNKPGTLLRLDSSSP